MSVTLVGWFGCWLQTFFGFCEDETRMCGHHAAAGRENDCGGASDKVFICLGLANWRRRGVNRASYWTWLMFGSCDVW